MKSSIYIIHDKKSPPLLMMNIWKHIYFKSNGFFVQSTEIIYENLKDMSEKMIAGVDHKGLQFVLMFSLYKYIYIFQINNG